MVLRRLIAAVALICAIAAPAYAQKTKAALTTEINTNWPDNTSGQITPALLRSTVLDIVNSYYDLNGGTSLSCAAHQWVAALPTLSSITCTQPTISDLSGFGAGVLTWLGTPSSANLAAALTDETGSGSAVFANAPTLVNPIVGTQTPGDNSTKAASTAFVANAVASNTTTSVIPSRAIAATLNLSSFAAITTQGYAAAGDGGGATFQKITGTFRDSYVNSGTITAAGSGYTNGLYLFVDMNGGTGTGLKANIQVTGGVIAAVAIVGGGGNGYVVGDILSTGAGNIGGTGSGFTWTVSTVSTPQASFTDTSGTKFQYVVNAGNYVNARQFGCKADWNGVDASATNDFTCLDAAIRFAAFRTSASRIDTGGTWGTAVVLPRGTSLVCGALIVQESVEIRGQGKYNSSWHLCDSGLAASSHFVTLGDPSGNVACFGSKLSNMSLSATTTAPANSNISMIFSNCIQQSEIISHVQVLAGLRNCFYYTNGYGGAEKYIVNDFQCELFTASSNDGVVLDPTTSTNQIFNGLVIEAGGSGYSGNAVSWKSGNSFINGFHSEGVVTGELVNATVSTYQGSLEAATGGSGCTQLVTLQGTNTAGNFRLGTAQKNGCTRLVTDGQSGGSNQTADQVLQKVFAP